eukprot:s696_g6.t1
MATVVVAPALSKPPSLKSGSCELQLLPSGWLYQLPPLTLQSTPPEVYGIKKPGGERFRDALEFHSASIERSEVAVPGLGSLPGLVVSGRSAARFQWQLSMALKDSARPGYACTSPNSSVQFVLATLYLLLPDCLCAKLARST